MKIDCSITKNYFLEKAKMVNQKEGVICGNCAKCPLSDKNNGVGLPCRIFECEFPTTAVKIVQQWSDEHQIKTRAERFFELFTNARRRPFSKNPDFCVLNLNNNIKCKCNRKCDECWEKPYEEGDF